jgi:hypothetical protein
MSTVPQIQSVAQLRSIHGFTIVRLRPTQPSIKSTALASPSIEAPNTSNLKTSVMTQLSSDEPSYVSSERESAPTDRTKSLQVKVAGVINSETGIFGVNDPLMAGTGLREVISRSHGQINIQSPPMESMAPVSTNSDEADTICLIGSDCYKPPYIPIMFYETE